MNIALLIETLDFGGAENVVQSLALALAPRGHNIFVYGLKAGGALAQALRTGGVTVDVAPAVHSRAGLPLWLLGRLRQDRIAIVHAHNSAALFWALPVAKLLRIPVVQTRHGTLLGQPSRYRRRADRIARWVDRTVIVAESQRPGLPPGHVRRDAIHIPNGIERPPVPRDVARQCLERLCGQSLPYPTVLSVGTLCPEKDTCGLLRAFAELRRACPAARLVLVGADRTAEYGGQVRELRRALRLSASVVLAGAVENAWQCMAGADVFCLGSQTEALPIALLEAMSQRVPIVATAVGDIGMWPPVAGSAGLLHHEQTALLVPPGDPAALAAALRRTLDEPDAARARAARAYDVCTQTYSVTAMARRYERVYEDSLRRRGRNAPARPALAPSAKPPRVLMVGPGPQQIGGMSGVITNLTTGALRNHCGVERWWPPTSSPAAAAAATAAIGHTTRFVGAVLRHGLALVHLARTIKRHRIDVVHIHTCSFQTFYRNAVDVLLARFLRRRVCVHIHGGRFAEFCAHAGPAGRWLIRWTGEAADAVFVLTRSATVGLRPFLGNSRVEVLPNAVPLGSPRAERDASRTTCRFVYLGALVKAKGLVELLDAAAQLRDQGIAFELCIAGPPSDAEPEDWPTRVAACGLTDHVRFMGTVCGAAKTEFLANADCLVLPSHAEGLPLVVLEAAALGLPVIATAVGGLPEFLAAAASDAIPADNDTPHIAPLVPPRDSAALARAMTRLAQDPGLRQRIGAGLQRRVAAEYSDEGGAARLTALYTEILRRPRHPPRGNPLSAWLVRNLTYPLHEWLRGRPSRIEWQALLTTLAATPGAIQQSVARRLRDLLAFAAAELPYYRRIFDERHLDAADADAFGIFHQLPLLTKPLVRQHAAEMTWRGVPGGPVRFTSGGTSGDTLTFYVDRRRQAQDQAARLFMQGLFGVRPGDRRLHLWGSPIENRGGRLRHWRDRLLNELLLNAFEMSPAQMDCHTARLLRFRPQVLYGYPSAVALLARHIAGRLGPRDFPWLRLVVLTGEEVTAEHRRQIQATFGCAVAAEYGSREVGLIAHDCPHGRMHVLAPHVLVEIAVGGKFVGAGICGEIVCTTLNARAQPFIRYRVGDVGRLLPGGCTCGLPFPLMQLEGGRVTGLIALPGGRLCHGAVSSYAVQGLPGILAYKTHQRQLDRFEVSLVVNERFQSASLDRIRQRYQALFGPHITVDVRCVEEIPPDPSGKRRHVVSDVAPNCLAEAAVATILTQPDGDV